MHSLFLTIIIIRLVRCTHDADGKSILTEQARHSVTHCTRISTIIIIIIIIAQ